MTNQLHKLTEQEKERLFDAPIKIAIMIAGADDKIEEKEIDWANKVIHFRRETAHYTLHQYYEHISNDFEGKFRAMLETYPAKAQERNIIISEELSSLKPILVKVDEHYREKLIESFKSFAKQVAEASGGILGFFSKNTEEEKWVHLTMFD